MKKLTLLALLAFVSVCDAQTLPIDFETSVNTSNFIDFDGGTATVIANPQAVEGNTSETVAQIVRNGGQIWAGSKIELAANLDFTSSNLISMKIFTTAPIGTTVKFKLEGTGETERDVQTTVTNAWETLTWDFTGEPTNFNTIVFMFDFGNVGDGSANSTFLFDDIMQEFNGSQIDLPVSFEEASVNYTTTDFGGNVSTLVTDPADSENTVVKVVKTEGAATWAGTTIGTPAGFATNIPLTLSDSQMTVRVWSPEAGTPIRLKVEDSNIPEHTCETEVNTTVAGDWENLHFNFANQATGTESLSVGLSMGWTYNMASIFFKFGTEGSVAGEKTYYFDDVAFGIVTVGIDETETETINVFPNPSSHEWTVVAENKNITLVEIFDMQGKRVLSFKPNQDVIKINAENFSKGIYTCKISNRQETKTIKLLKK